MRVARRNSDGKELSTNQLFSAENEWPQRVAPKGISKVNIIDADTQRCICFSTNSCINATNYIAATFRLRYG